MEKFTKKKLIAGYIMATCGFILMIITAMNYPFHWKAGIPAAAIGIIFLAVGMSRDRKMKNNLEKK